MLMKLLPAAVLGLVLAACDQTAADARNAEQSERDGDDRYTIELVAGHGSAVHYIHGEGHAAALITEEDDTGAARLIRGRQAERAWLDAAGDLDLAEPDPADLKIKVFGFELYADPDDREGGQVRIDAGIPGGRHFALNAAGENDDGAARLTFSGWDADDTERYIDGIENAPRDVRADMKDELGL